MAFKELCEEEHDSQRQTLNLSQVVNHLCSPDNAHSTFKKLKKFDTTCDDEASTLTLIRLNTINTNAVDNLLGGIAHATKRFHGRHSLSNDFYVNALKEGSIQCAMAYRKMRKHTTKVREKVKITFTFGIASVITKFYSHIFGIFSRNRGKHRNRSILFRIRYKEPKKRIVFFKYLRNGHIFVASKFRPFPK